MSLSNSPNRKATIPTELPELHDQARRQHTRAAEMAELLAEGSIGRGPYKVHVANAYQTTIRVIRAMTEAGIENREPLVAAVSDIPNILRRPVSRQKWGEIAQIHRRIAEIHETAYNARNIIKQQCSGTIRGVRTPQGDWADEFGPCQEFADTCPIHGPDARVFVNVYLCELGYGGAEEGGWWYDIDRIQMVYPTLGRHAEELKKRLEEGEYSNEGRPPKSSTNSTGVYDVRIEDHPGETSPKERPRYE